MKEQIITEMQRRMLPYLNNEQLMRLQEAMEYALHGVQIVADDHLQEKKQPDAVAAFIAAKRIEGCSEKTLKYYQSTIEAVLSGLGKTAPQITTEDLRQYLTRYQVQRKSSKVTIDNIRRSRGKKESFINRWKDLEELCEKIFHPISGTPMDELFTRYMYFVRAKKGIKSSTTDALRKFYEREDYTLLKSEETFDNLIVLANFWNDVSNQDRDRFSTMVLRRLFVLNYAPNSMWTYFVSVYFMQNRKKDGTLDEDAFVCFLDKITGFIWTYAVTNPGVNALRTPVYAEMVNIVNNQPVDFADYRFEADKVRSMFGNFSFHNARPITKSMITWWAFTKDDQPLLSLEAVLEIEHIYARKRQDMEKSLTNPANLESLGNKVLLEKRINIRAADYRFKDKVAYYNGFTNSRGQVKEGTKIHELLDLAQTKTDFTEADIVARNEGIMEAFIMFLQNNGLIKG